MILDSISLKDFRNFVKKEISFSESGNLIVGPNASGKTNLLEAIYLLATGKSFRVKGVESEMIGYGKEIGRVMGVIKEIGEKKGKEETKLEIVLTWGEVMGQKTGKKKYLVNGVGKRALDFVGNLRAVYFGPEDLQLVTDSPSLRRRYLDLVLSQVDREYYRSLLSYEKGLRARNKLLELARETGEVDRRKFYFWDQLLIKNGNLVTEKRQGYINFVNNFGEIGEIRDIGEMGGFKIEYDQSTISRERLLQYEREEIAAGATLVGPHRDDLKFKVQSSPQIFFQNSTGQAKFKVNEEKRDLAIYGSRGEQRLAILWLKLGELTFIRSKTGELPVLLLDDIFSELDMEHRQLVFEAIGNQQAIITTADLGMVEKEWLEGVKIIKLAETDQEEQEG